MAYNSKRARFYRLMRYEKELRLEGFLKIAGVDEAGIGPLAGPVVAAACVLPEKTVFAGLNDSKQMDPALREKLFLEITQHPQVRFGIGIVDVETIDQINILQASFLAMKQAVLALYEIPDYVIVDGRNFPEFGIRGEAIIEGDAKCASIAAASVLAKVTRDRIMIEHDTRWPHYKFAKHKGYSTREHIEAIEKWGPCPIHRTSYARFQ